MSSMTPRPSPVSTLVLSYALPTCRSATALPVSRELRPGWQEQPGRLMLAVLDDRLCVHGPGTSVGLAGWRRWRAADMPPFAGGHAVCLPESAAEVGGIGEAPASGDRGDGLVTPARTDQVVPGRVEAALEDPPAPGPGRGC